tara:strand:- start:496 stop:2331 length:1836 start_codon:yes stop_codon:yes gene_type:complete
MTYEVKVNQAGFSQMLRRMARDCPNNQWLREFVKNSLEAIEEYRKESGNLSFKGEVIIDVDWHFYELTGYYKVSIIDNGIGMTPEEMQKYISQLSSSSPNKSTNDYENYGIGAKISAITRNTKGIVYKSWKEGEGYLVQMIHDESKDIYGLSEFVLDDGSFVYSQPIEDDLKHEVIKEHGTVVTLYGNKEEDDTMNNVTHDLPGSSEAWILGYLNRRFFSLPEHTQVKCRIGYNRDRKNTKHHYLANCNGYEHTLNKIKEKSGEVKLSDATIKWHILKKDRGQGHGREFVTGHTAVVHENELFDVSTGMGNKASRFGLAIGQEDVVFHVLPATKKYSQDTSRSRVVLIGQEDLPWKRWAIEFRENFPEELNQYMSSLINRDQDNFLENIKKKLMAYKQFYNLSKYKLTKAGKIEVDATELVEGVTGGTRTGTGGTTTSSSGTNVGLISDYLSICQKPGSKVMAKKISDPFPGIEWVQEENEKIQKEEIRDRAAVFKKDLYRIFANSDFQGYVDIRNHFSKKYKNVPEERIKNIVENVFGMELVESIAGLMSLEKRKHWAGEKFEKAYSPEALTATVSSRSNFVKTIERQVRLVSLATNQESSDKELAEDAA